LCLASISRCWQIQPSFLCLDRLVKILLVVQNQWLVKIARYLAGINHYIRILHGCAVSFLNGI